MKNEDKRTGVKFRMEIQKAIRERESSTQKACACTHIICMPDASKVYNNTISNTVSDVSLSHEVESHLQLKCNGYVHAMTETRKGRREETETFCLYSGGNYILQYRVSNLIFSEQLKAIVHVFPVLQICNVEFLSYGNKLLFLFVSYYISLSVAF